MKYRDVTIFSGQKFTVPQNVQRIDHLATHGWQLRYGGTKLFSDHTSDGSGAAASLEAATKELLRRIAKLPAPSRLQQKPNHNKTSDLPVGISGPIVRQRAGARVTRESLVTALESLHNIDLGGLLLNYGPGDRTGLSYVDTVIVKADGQFVH